MNKTDTRRVFLLCALFTFLNTLPAVLHALETVELQLDVRLSWTATRRDPGPRCFTIRLPEPGVLQVELTTAAPSTAPGVIVLAAEDEGEAPDTLIAMQAQWQRIGRLVPG